MYFDSSSHVTEPKKRGSPKKLQRQGQRRPWQAKGQNKKQQERAVAEGEAEEESEGDTVMALRASGELVPVDARGRVLRTTPGPMWNRVARKFLAGG